MRTLNLKDRRDGLRIQRTPRRASTPRAHRKRARPQLRYRPLMPSWRMGRSTRLNHGPPQPASPFLLGISVPQQYMLTKNIIVVAAMCPLVTLGRWLTRYLLSNEAKVAWFTV